MLWGGSVLHFPDSPGDALRRWGNIWVVPFRRLNCRQLIPQCGGRPGQERARLAPVIARRRLGWATPLGSTPYHALSFADIFNLAKIILSVLTA